MKGVTLNRNAQRQIFESHESFVQKHDCLKQNPRACKNIFFFYILFHLNNKNNDYLMHSWKFAGMSMKNYLLDQMLS